MKDRIKFVLIGVIGMLVLIAFNSCSNQQTDESNVESFSGMKISDSLKWSERMALSIMKRHPEAYQIDNRTDMKWDYVHGLVLLSFEKLYKSTGEIKYYDYVKDYADLLIDSTGNIATYKFSNYNIDMINAGKILFDLYATNEDPRYLNAMNTLRKQLAEQPRTTVGGFWHKKRYPNQMWLDGLYMGSPFYAQYTVLFEEGKGIDDVANQFIQMNTHARDEATGLLYHGWDESKEMDWANKETGTSPNFWSRAMGWYAMALVDVLDYFPEDHPKRELLIDYLNQLAIALTSVQDESGLWYQVTDMGDREGNYLEASGSSMFAYALAKGANKGYLQATYLDVANKAFDGLTNLLIKVDEDGEVHLTDVCAVAGLGGNPYRDGSYEYYVNERRQDNDPKGTGPFIMAALELDR